MCGLRTSEERTEHDYHLAWAVIIGSIPVAVVGFLDRNVVTSPPRSLWVVAAALFLWSMVMSAAERRHTVLQKKAVVRGEGQVTMRDGLILGICRSGRGGLTGRAQRAHRRQRIGPR